MIYIGKSQTDGSVKYIALLQSVGGQKMTQILKTFYSKESRVDALIELGDISFLNPTPYGNSTGYSDKIHCRAEIRDDKQKKGKRLARYMDSEELFAKLATTVLLYKERRWHINTESGYCDQLPNEIISTPPKPFEGLTIYLLNEKGDIEQEYSKEIYSWAALYAKAKAENRCYHIFRGDKLVQTINLH